MSEWGHLYDRKWRKRRARQLAEYPLCRLCQEIRGEVVPATVADHVEPHRNDPVLFAGPLQSLCAPCHNSWKQAMESGSYIRGSDVRGNPLDPRLTWNGGPGLTGFGVNRERAFQELRMPSDLRLSRIPCVMVCGPPNGGKHPYVIEHAGVNDVVIDLDKIMVDLSGLPAWESGASWLDRSLAERNRQLRALASDATHERAWFLINAPDPTERALWARRLGATVTILAPSLAECLRRIKAEPYHKGYTERMLKAASQWWAKNNSGARGGWKWSDPSSTDTGMDQSVNQSLTKKYG
jgi:5-methylcytosine-specific restriction protein A